MDIFLYLLIRAARNFDFDVISNLCVHRNCQYV